MDDEGGAQEVIEVCGDEGCKSHLRCVPQWEKDYIYRMVLPVIDYYLLTRM